VFRSLVAVVVEERGICLCALRGGCVVAWWDGDDGGDRVGVLRAHNVE
jgi:hypothetical protein